jgi:hypothetical protein
MRGDRSVEWPGGGLPVVRWRQACTLARPAASLPRACRVGPTDMHARCGGQCMPWVSIGAIGMGWEYGKGFGGHAPRVRCVDVAPRRARRRRACVGRSAGPAARSTTTRDVPAVSTVWCFTRTQTPVAPCIICAPCAMMCVRARRTVPVRPLKP